MALTALLALTGALAPVGHAATLVYVSPAGSDANDCLDPAHPCATINGAIGKASDGDTIRIAGGTYTATSGDEVVLIDKNVTLEGGYDATFGVASGVSTIDAQGLRRGVTVAAGKTASISDFSIEHGSWVDGAGVGNEGQLVLQQTTVSNNTAGDSGGGLYGFSGSTTRVIDSTFAKNTAQWGGAFYLLNSSLALVNSTVADNDSWRGTGVSIHGASHLQASNATIANNTSNNGGGLYLDGDPRQSATLRNTILAGNTSANGTPDCDTAVSSTVTSDGNNLIGNANGCAITAQASDIIGGKAYLAQLADNGGHTETMALQPASDAIDAGNANNGCRDDLGQLLMHDQSGYDRTFGIACDIGAYEAGAPPNDDLASAQALDPSSGTLVDGNRYATVEQNEPVHAGDEGGASVWFTWTPSFTGPVSIDTTQSSFDTLLAVYEGSGPNFSDLALRASNDDFGAPGNHPSRVCLDVTSGTTYAIAIDGYAGATGVLHLTWGPRVPGDNSACPTLPPQVTGVPFVGEWLTSSTGTWIGNTFSFQRQWIRCQAKICTDIRGEQSARYNVTPRDVGTSIRVEVLAQNGGVVSLSDPTDVVSGPAATHANGRMYWSTNRDAGDWEIYSMFSDGAGLLRLTNHAGNDTEPVPSPDGTEVAFVRDGHLALMNADGSGLDVGPTAASPTWSPDGSRIAYVTDSRHSISIVDINGSNLVRLFYGDPGAFYDLAWSPDGSKIALAYQPTPSSHSNIWLVPADGRGAATQLTNAATDDHSPAWSPDGTKLLFVRGPTSGSSADLYMMHTDGSGQTLLHSGGAKKVTSGVWSPDGTKVLFSELQNGNSDLFTAAPDGSGLAQLTTDGNSNELPAWGALATYWLTASRTGSGSGTITSAPTRLACGPVCAVIFPERTQVQLTAAPAFGSTFAGWSGACSGTGTCTVTMLGARDVTAMFIPVQAPTPPPSSGGGGGGGGGGEYGPDLVADVSANAATAPPVGSDLIFSVTVRTKNSGVSSAVQLNLTLPAGFTLNRTYIDRGSCTGTAPNLTCNVAWINPGTSTHVTLFGTVTQAGELDVIAEVKSLLEPEFDPKNNTTTFKLLPSTAPPPGGGSFSPPQALRPPTILGKHKVGSTVQASLPDWDIKPTRLTYQWQLCTGTSCVAIRGATKLTLKLLPAYAGHSVRIVATATAPGGSATSASKRFVVTRH